MSKKVAFLSDAALMFLHMKSRVETEFIGILSKMIPDGAPSCGYKLVIHKGFGPVFDTSKTHLRTKAELKEDIVKLEGVLLQTISLISEIGGVPCDPLDPDGSKAAAIQKEKERTEIQAQIEALKVKLTSL